MLKTLRLCATSRIYSFPSVRTRQSSTMSEIAADVPVVESDKDTINKDANTPSNGHTAGAAEGERVPYKWKKAKKMAAMLSFSGKVFLISYKC